jgi:hypothetical protein
MNPVSTIGGIPVAQDVRQGGPHFTDEVTRLWPRLGRRSSRPEVDRKTLKAHALAQVSQSARSDRRAPNRAADPGLKAAAPAVDGPPAPSELARGSQTTPRLPSSEPAIAPAFDALAVPARPAAVAESRPGSRSGSPSTDARDRGARSRPPTAAVLSRQAAEARLAHRRATAGARRSRLGSWTGRSLAAVTPEKPSARSARSFARLELALSVGALLLAIVLWVIAFRPTWLALELNDRARAAWQELQHAATDMTMGEPATLAGGGR